VHKNAQPTKEQDEPFDVLEYYRRYRNEELIKYMPYRSGLRVLDCGCREGVLLDQLDGRTEATWGVDRSLPTAALALAPDQTAIAYGHRLPFATEIFDVVFGSETLQQGSGPAHVVSELARVLRPNGWLILWESRRQLRHVSRDDLSRWIHEARLVPRYAEPFDCLAFPAALTISLIPPLARSYTAQTLTKAMFALDEILLRVPALCEKSWHLIVTAQKEDPGDG
jgi:SAM-dependent methyltransferase